MTYPDSIRRGFSLGLLTLAVRPQLGWAQNYPVRPVRIVLPYSAGSGPDALIRAMGVHIGRELGQPLVIENRPGGNGWIGVGEVKRAAPDGYTLLMCDANIMTLHQHLFRQIPFDPVKDFEGIAPLYATSYFVVANPNSPWNNLSDLLAAARRKDGAVTYASWGMGSPGHIGSAMLENAAGIKLHHVPYKDIPAVYQAVASGDVDWAYGSAGSIAPLFAAKKLKLIAFTGPQRFSAQPNIATVAEQRGTLADFELSTWAAIYAPRGTPTYAMERVRDAFVKALNEPDIKARLDTFGFAPWFASRSEFEQAAEADSRKYKDIIGRARIVLE